MADARGAFDDDLEIDALGSPLGAFDRRHQGIDSIDVAGAPGLGDHDLVQPITGLFQQVHHVAIPEGRVQSVDTDRQRLVAPVDVANGLDDVLARPVLVVGRHRVFQVQVDDIGCGFRHLLEQAFPRSGAKQLAAVQAGRRQGLGAKAHARIRSEKICVAASNIVSHLQHQARSLVWLDAPVLWAQDRCHNR